MDVLPKIRHLSQPSLHLIFSLLLLLTTVIPALAGSKPLGANIRITQGSDASDPELAILGNTVYAVWEDFRDVWDEGEIYLAKSTDGGVTWGSHVNVGQGAGNQIGVDDPSLAVGPDGTVYVVWYNPYSSNDLAEFYFTRSTNGGASFENPQHGAGTAASRFEPRIAADPNGTHVYVAVSISEAGGYNIYRIWSDGRGASGTWSSFGRINDVSGSGVFEAMMDIAAGNNVVYAAWEDQRNGATRIYGDKSTDHGASFGADFAISPPGVAATQPRLAIGPDGTLYAAYTANAQVYLSRSTNGGQNWSTPVQVSQTGENELGGWDMAVDGNGSVVVLWAMGSWSSGISDLYLSTSINSGQNFTHLHIEDNQGEFPEVSGQYQPAIAATGNGDNARAVMLWQDTRNSGDEIWSARAEIDATPPTAPSNLQATPGDTVVDLIWNAANDRNGIAAYHVLRAATEGGPYTLVNALPITGFTYRDVGLTSGNYVYKVFAVDGTGNLGGTSNPASAVVVAGSNLPVSGVIAYENGNQVEARDLPGKDNLRTIATGAWPQFAADGQRIYYRDSTQIISRDLAGGNPQTFFSNDELTDAFAIDRADPSYFAWVQQHRYSQTNPFEIWDVFEPHFGTTASSQFVDDYEFAASPTIASGRHWLAYASAGHHGMHQTPYNYNGHSALVVADLTTGNRAATYSNANYQDPAFAPGGTKLAFAADFSGQYEIWTADVQGNGSLTDFRQITHGGAGLWSRGPAWSPDGAWLIFHRDTNPGAGEALQLFVVQAEGAALRGLAVSGSEPAWHNSGQPPANDHRVYLPWMKR